MNLNKEILRLSVPAIVSNITVPILGLSDTTISGHLGSEVYIGAIAVGTMMFNVAFWLFGFLRMGTTGLTAQAFGANDETGCRMLLYRSILLALFIGLGLILLSLPLKWLLLKLISPDADVACYASRYFMICIIGAPPVLVNMALQGWFLGMQNTLYPMIISVSVNLINIILSLLFVFIFGLGFEGVAYGTLIANYVGLLLGVVLLKIFYGSGLKTVGVGEILRIDGLRQFFRVNTDIFFRSGCIMAVSMSVTAIGAQLGALTLAANAIIMQFFILFSYFMDGFAFAGEAMVGRSYGANDKIRLRKVVNLLSLWGLGVALIFTAVYVLFYQDIVAFITTQSDVVMEVDKYRMWLMLMPIVTVMAFVFDGVFIGLTATRQMLLVTFFSTIVFFAVCFVHYDMGVRIAIPDNDHLWLGFLLYLLSRGVLLALIYRGKLRKWVVVNNLK